MTTVTALVNQADYSATLADVAYLRHHLAAAQAEAAQWRARYMAAHDVMLCVEEYIEVEIPLYPNMDRAQIGRLEKYHAMRASFLAYRAAVEAGAPLGWAVAEEQQQPDAEAQSTQRGA